MAKTKKSDNLEYCRGIRVMDVAVYVFALLAFGVYPLIYDDHYFNITITKYHFFLYAAGIYLALALIGYVVEANLKNYYKYDSLLVEDTGKKRFLRPEFYALAFLMANFFAWLCADNKKDAFCDACCYSLDDSQVNDNELDMITNLFKKILTVPINNGFQSRLSLFKFFSFSFIGFTIIVEFYYSLMYNGFDMLFFVYSLCMYILFIMSGYFLREFKKYVFQDHKSSLKNYSLSFDDFMTKFFDKIAGFPIQNNSEIKISKFKFIGFLIFGIILAFVYYMSFNNYYLSDYISWIFHNFYLIDQISWIIYGIFFYIVFWILSKISD